MLLKDVLFSQGFGTRYDCAAMVASGAVEIAAEVHDDPDEDVETEGLVFRCLGRTLRRRSLRSTSLRATSAR